MEAGGYSTVSPVDQHSLFPSCDERTKFVLPKGANDSCDECKDFSCPESLAV